MRAKTLRYSGAMRCVLMGLLVVAGCTTPNANKICKAGQCSDPAFPYCDTEGVISGDPGTCIAVSCAPRAVQACVDNDALTCNATGDGFERLECELGCI